MNSDRGISSAPKLAKCAVCSWQSISRYCFSSNSGLHQLLIVEEIKEFRFSVLVRSIQSRQSSIFEEYRLGQRNLRHGNAIFLNFLFFDIEILNADLDGFFKNVHFGTHCFALLQLRGFLFNFWDSFSDFLNECGNSTFSVNLNYESLRKWLKFFPIST